MASIRLSVPKSAKIGEIVEIKALIQHDMESGFRRGRRGEVIPRDIIVLFECLFDDDVVFSADFFPGVSANPFLTFSMRVERFGTLLFRWTDQNGEVWTDSAAITAE